MHPAFVTRWRPFPTRVTNRVRIYVVMIPRLQTRLAAYPTWQLERRIFGLSVPAMLLVICGCVSMASDRTEAEFDRDLCSSSDVAGKFLKGGSPLSVDLEGVWWEPTTPYSSTWMEFTCDDSGQLQFMYGMRNCTSGYYADGMAFLEGSTVDLDQTVQDPLGAFSKLSVIEYEGSQYLLPWPKNGEGDEHAVRDGIDYESLLRKGPFSHE